MRKNKKNKMAPRSIVVLISFMVVMIFSFKSITHAQQECYMDENCASNQKCKNYKCVNVCNNVTCSDNEDCIPYYHWAMCGCKPGFSFDNLNKCQRVCNSYLDCPGVHQDCTTINGIRRCLQIAGGACNWNGDCPSSSMCFENICMDPCLRKSCMKRHEYCVVKNHKAICECTANYARSNPANDCMIQCRNSFDCLYDYQSCVSKQGMKVCACDLGFAPSNKHGGPCLLLCEVDNDCGPGYWCNNQRCIECDGIICAFAVEN